MRQLNKIATGKIKHEFGLDWYSIRYPGKSSTYYVHDFTCPKCGKVRQVRKHWYKYAMSNGTWSGYCCACNNAVMRKAYKINRLKEKNPRNCLPIYPDDTRFKRNLKAMIAYLINKQIPHTAKYKGEVVELV